jgi:hypothetical protein
VREKLLERNVRGKFKKCHPAETIQRRKKKHMVDLVETEEKAMQKD